MAVTANQNFSYMKKIVLGAIAAAATLTASAEGYQVNTLSARQIGMAHTGTAMNLGAESMFFNPAGLGFLDKTLDVSASVSGIMATASATTGGQKYTTDNNVSTPIMVGAAFSIYDNLKAGITFYTPYGSSINWTDNWPGAVLNQSVDLKVYTIQPTVAWKILPRLSVGAGLILSWGTVDLNKGLVSASSMDAVLTAMQSPVRFGNTTPASVNLNGTADVAFGANFGAKYDINDRWAVGASFRTQMNMKVKAGQASLKYANEAAETILSSLKVLNESDFKSEMPCPWVLSLGATYKPIDKLLLAFDARLTGWKAYKSLDIEFLSEQLTPFNQYITKDYKNAWGFSLGAEYAVTKRFDARAGIMIDTTPVNSEHYNPETPGMTKVEPSLGFSFRPIPQLSIDLGVMYVAGLGKDNAVCDYTDLLAAQNPQLGLSPKAEFKADYTVHAWIPSIGVNFSF